jgi:prepilin-type N-terminal cleavage/methylation domain-containing protein
MLGFTLIELMTVLAILGVLTVLAMPTLTGVYKRSTLGAEGRRLLGAFTEARGLALSKGTRHELLFDRTNSRWEMREDSNRDNVFERLITQHPAAADTWPSHIAFGPLAGITPAYPVPYNGFPHNAWCATQPAGACTATLGTLVMDVDGRITDASGNLVSGAVMLYDSTGSTGDVQTVVFVGATGNVRLYNMSH